MATNLITKCKEEKEYAQFSTRARPNHFLKEEEKKQKKKWKKNLSDEGKKWLMIFSRIATVYINVIVFAVWLCLLDTFIRSFYQFICLYIRWHRQLQKRHTHTHTNNKQMKKWIIFDWLKLCLRRKYLPNMPDQIFTS